MVEGGTQTSESLVQLPLDATDAPPTVGVIPPAPPPPPIWEDGVMIPPPPPVPFGKTVECICRPPATTTIFLLKRIYESISYSHPSNTHTHTTQESHSPLPSLALAEVYPEYNSRNLSSPTSPYPCSTGFPSKVQITQSSRHATSVNSCVITGVLF